MYVSAPPAAGFSWLALPPVKIRSCTVSRRTSAAADAIDRADLATERGVVRRDARIPEQIRELIACRPRTRRSGVPPVLAIVVSRPLMRTLYATTSRSVF